jgi:hypothetical protein
MSKRINARCKTLSTTKFTVWKCATRRLGLKPAQQVAPTPGQIRAGGATMLFSTEQEKQIRRALMQAHAKGRTRRPRGAAATNSKLSAEA